MDGQKRPLAAKVHDSFSKFRAIEELPKKLRLEVQSIDIPFIGPEPGPWYEVVLGYGGRGYTVGVRRKEGTTKVSSTSKSGHMWSALCPTQFFAIVLSLEQGHSANLDDKT